MKVKEAIEIINNGHFDSLWDAEDAIMDDSVEEVATGLNSDSHRWYIVETNVYKLEDGYLGISGVSELKSEAMGYGDCFYDSTAQEYEEITTVSYRPKK